MARIITFPRTKLALSQHRPRPFAARIVSMGVRIVWMLTIIAWPALRWIAALDVTLQLFRMLMLFADKGIHVDWTFIAHVSCFVALVCFATMYRPH